MEALAIGISSSTGGWLCYVESTYCSFFVSMPAAAGHQKLLGCPGRYFTAASCTVHHSANQVAVANAVQGTDSPDAGRCGRSQQLQQLPSIHQLPSLKASTTTTTFFFFTHNLPTYSAALIFFVPPSRQPCLFAIQNLISSSGARDGQSQRNLFGCEIRLTLNQFFPRPFLGRPSYPFFSSPGLSPPSWEKTPASPPHPVLFHPSNLSTRAPNQRLSSPFLSSLYAPLRLALPSTPVETA